MRASGFFRSSFTYREKPSVKPGRAKISLTSAVSDPSQCTLHIRRSNARVRGSRAQRCVEERMGNFRVWKTHQEGALQHVVESKSDVFVNLPTGFRSISSFVYSVIFCGATKLEPKKTDALAGYSLFTAALFLAWKPQKYFYPQNDAFTDCGSDWWNRHQEDSYWRKDLGETFFICLPTESMIYHTLLFWHYSKR